MDIIFASRKLRKLFSTKRDLIRKFGPQQANAVGQRLYDLQAATTLADIGHLPPARCHELMGDRAGQLSVDLKHPYRLIFEPANEPVPQKADGGLDWSEITMIRICGVEDTHE